MMKPTADGWFCKGCQKTVYDFTGYSDEQLAQIYENKEGRCGMFLDSQINRELLVPKRSRTAWIAATAALSFFTLGINKGNAQEIGQQSKGKFLIESKSGHNQGSITGFVKHIWGSGVKGAKVKIKGTSSVAYTDENGDFTIDAKVGDILKITARRCKPTEVIVTQDAEYHISLLYRNKSLNKRRVPGYF